MTACENGCLARDELLKENCFFDLVLLDVHLDDESMEGITLLTLMKSIEKLSKIPVIMMSADNQKEMIIQCIAKGAKDYLVKPIRLT